MRNICVIGTGYVGLVTGTCLAELGNRVVCLDVDEAKIDRLQSGSIPIYEPGLAELVQRNVALDRLAFTTSYPDALAGVEFVFISVPTPKSEATGEADLSYVRQAAIRIAQDLRGDAIVINKSTVPIGTGDLVAQILKAHVRDGVNVRVVSNPEFLREGSAVRDCLNPDRVVLGSCDRAAAEDVASLYLSLQCPILITDLATAEMIKYASNAMLAARISFMNEIARICEQLGADAKQVAIGMGYDKRIGPAFLDAGLGYGGSCFPKDVQALMHMGYLCGCHPQLLQAVADINVDQRAWPFEKLVGIYGDLRGKTIGLLGLAFKPNTDDLREAPAIDIARMLIEAGAEVAAFDPVAMDAARRLLPDLLYCDDAYQAATGADAVILVTDWPEFRDLDLERLGTLMRSPVMIDGRNLYDPETMQACGFEYRGVGRRAVAAKPAARIVEPVRTPGTLAAAA
ncbi:MAG TPA: UDP-glucose/GDP-mannose dehydrogenase family protein [Chloroflexota bacterium]|nr:UDP-glucose/GDP-mannose dehydrogenase family protein [Chloroflexota bacterium]